MKRKKKMTWRERMKVKKEMTKTYNSNQSFYTGDIISHKNFGLGYVESSFGNKIDVLFEDRARTLVHMVMF